MSEDDERNDAGVGLGRTLALSDGIFAISMTLLAFQIQAPNLAPSQVHTLAHRLARMASTYWVFALSFAVIGLFWLIHQRLLRHVDRADEPLMVLNLAFLMVVAILPFPSSMLGRYGNERVSVILYASVMALAGMLLFAMTILVQRRVVSPSAETILGLRRGRWRSGAMVGAFLISIPVAIVAPTHAPLVWIATGGTRFLPLKARSRKRGDRPPTPSAGDEQTLA